MYEYIYNFMSEWLGETGDLSINLPWTSTTWTLAQFWSFTILAIALLWILWFIIKIINSLFRIF